MNLSTQTLTSGPDLVTYLNTPIHNGLFGNFKGFSSAYQAIDFSVLEENYANVDKHIQGVCKGHYLSVIVNGPSGVGKSFSVDAYLQQYAQEDTYKVVQFGTIIAIRDIEIMGDSSLRGAFEGKDLIVNSNGGAFIGNFKNNEFISGFDIYTNANEFFRLRDEAIEKNLSEDGRLKYILENFRGKYYLGSFINSKRDGKGMYFDDGGYFLN